MEVKNALRDKVISSICTMDVRMLDTLLPDDGRFENTYKEVWLAKLVSFFKACKMIGDTSLTVHDGQCAARNSCSCRQHLWIFKAEKTDKRFAIYFNMEGDEIKAVHRCFGYHHSDKEVPHLEDVFDYEAFYVHEHEKIGFINSYELDELRKNVKLFLTDMRTPRWDSMPVIDIKRILRKYSNLYIDVVDTHHLFEHKSDLLNIYEDLLNIKNIFTQRKSFELVVAKCNELMDSYEVKSKTKVLKWFLRNKKKVSNYLIFFNTIDVEEDRTWFFYRIGNREHRWIINHPDINLDVEACILLQTYIIPFYDYLQNEYVKENTFMAHVDSEGMLYDYFKDKMEHVMEPCEEWIYSR